MYMWIVFLAVGAVSSCSCCLLDSRHYKQVFKCVCRNTNIFITMCIHQLPKKIIYMYTTNCKKKQFTCITMCICLCELFFLAIGGVCVCVCLSACLCVCVFVCVCVCVSSGSCCLLDCADYAQVHIGHFPQKSPIISGSFGSWCCFQCFLLSADYAQVQGGIES